MRRLHYFDGLRGWAALVVVLHHLELTFAPELQGQKDAISPILGPFSFLADGPLAVAIFFILSGIVLSEGLKRTEVTNPVTGLTSLILKRWLRLSLPIIAAGILVLTLFALLGDRTVETGRLTGSGWIEDLFPPGYRPDLLEVLHEAILGAFIGPNTPLHDPVLWTIRVEFLGSILVFALCLFVRSGFARLAACALAGAALIATPAWLLNFCALFAISVAISDLRHLSTRDDQEEHYRMLRDITGLGMIFLATCVYPVLDLHLPVFMQRLGEIADPAGHLSQWTARSLLIVGGLILSRSAQDFLSRPPSLFLGRISFGLYLLHVPLLWSVGGSAYIAMSRHWPHWAAAVVASLLVLIGSGLAAAIFHRLVERPAIRIAAKASNLRLYALRRAS
ncbi:acyltransferase family protein [Dongia soli]|uniref:Acyltransferase n=1 Tax=Dongia soli TaxID=600628 RepID=A0ABU5E7E6_9PROT|nr:acyltransferase [Dongia soli]MDY0881463.1 acyltransferase [Dongia soli]